MSGYVFNEDVANLAIRMALPTIRRMRPIGTWGPAGVVIGVDGPGLEEPVIHVMQELKEDDTYQQGEFLANVRAKLRPSKRTGNTSRHMLDEDPAGLQMDDSLYPGSAVEGSVVVAASGWYGVADEAVSWVVWNCVHFICQMISKRMRETGYAFVGDAYPQTLRDVRSLLIAGWEGIEV